MIVKGSTSLRRFCWLQGNFSHGQCPAADFGASNGRNCRGVRVLRAAWKLPVDLVVGTTLWVDGQLPGTAANWQSRPEADSRDWRL